MLRLHVDAWQMAGDVEAAAKEAMERYQLSVADGDRVEVVETLQSVGHDGSL